VFASAQRIWVLEQPDQIVEYDPQSFARKTSHEIPKDALQYPQDLQISKAGQMLFLRPVWALFLFAAQCG
jgi:hypothetical protein